MRQQWGGRNRNGLCPPPLPAALTCAALQGRSSFWMPAGQQCGHTRQAGPPPRHRAGGPRTSPPKAQPQGAPPFPEPPSLDITSRESPRTPSLWNPSSPGIQKESTPETPPGAPATEPRHRNLSLQGRTPTPGTHPTPWSPSHKGETPVTPSPPWSSPPGSPPSDYPIPSPFPERPTREPSPGPPHTFLPGPGSPQPSHTRCAPLILRCIALRCSADLRRPLHRAPFL